MPKTPEEVIAKMERRHANIAAHLVGLIDHNAGLRKDVKRLEDLLLWIHRTEQPIEEIRRVIEKTIPTRLRKEHENGVV